MSVTAARVKTMQAQNPRTGVGVSSSHTKNGIATMRANVSRFGRLRASRAFGGRRRTSSGARFVTASSRLAGTNSNHGVLHGGADENRAVAGETDEAALPIRCLRRR